MSVVGQLSVWDKVSHRRRQEPVWSEVRGDPRLMSTAAPGQALPWLLWTLWPSCAPRTASLSCLEVGPMVSTGTLQTPPLPSLVFSKRLSGLAIKTWDGLVAS